MINNFFTQPIFTNVYFVSNIAKPEYRKVSKNRYNFRGCSLVNIDIINYSLIKKTMNHKYNT